MAVRQQSRETRTAAASLPFTYTQLKALRNNSTMTWLQGMEDDPVNARMQHKPAAVACTEARHINAAAVRRGHKEATMLKDVGAWAQGAKHGQDARVGHGDIDLEQGKGARKDIKAVLDGVDGLGFGDIGKSR